MAFSKVSRYPVLLTALAAVLVSACDQISAPSQPGIGDTFVLTEADGIPLPLDMMEQSGFDATVLADTLRFSPYGTVARSLYIRHRGDEIVRHFVVRPYKLDGPHVVIGRDPRRHPPNEESRAPDFGGGVGVGHGILRPGGLTMVTGSYLSMPGILEYDRFDPRWAQ